MLGAHWETFMGVIIQRLVVCLSNAFMVASGILLMLMMLHICLGAAFNLMLPTVNLNTLTVVAGWYMIGVTFFPMCSTQPLSVNITGGWLPEAFRDTVRWLVSLASAVAFGFIAYLTFEEALSQTLVSEMWETSTGFFPVWPARWVLPCVFSTMALREACKLIMPHSFGRPATSSIVSD